MTIRRTLFGLIGSLSVILLAIVAVQIVKSVLDWREMNHLATSNLVRERLAQSASTLAAERTASFLELAGLPSDSLPSSDLRPATDRALTLTARTLEELSTTDPVYTTVVRELRNALAALRAQGDATRLAEPTARSVAARNWLVSGIDLVEALNSLRLKLLAQENPTDPITATAFRLRSQASSFLEYLMRNRVLLPGLAADGVSGEWLNDSERSALQAEIALDLMHDQESLVVPRLRKRIEAIRETYLSEYRPAERAVLLALEEGRPAGELLPLAERENQILLDTTEELLDELFIFSRDYLADLRASAAMNVGLWIVLFLLCGYMAGASMYVVNRRVIRPIRSLSAAMLHLAEGDLERPLPPADSNDEMASMFDALRVFRTNAMRRRRLQIERLALHGRLKGAYRQLKVDLEAAAAVQTTLLPTSACLNGVAFSSLFRPSNFIAGDTFDVVRHQSGKITFFQIDVAGHGAPAALISIASHHRITQAVLQRRPEEDLAKVVAELNSEWPENLPYFTLILGEIDPHMRRGTLVQAGHPPPILVSQLGGVTPLGQGGLPIGILPGAYYDTVDFSFAPGDRLVIYSDGLVEAENPNEQPFSQERLQALILDSAGRKAVELLSVIDRSLRKWRGSGKLDDDVTVLILEGEWADEYRGGTARERADSQIC